MKAITSVGATPNRIEILYEVLVDAEPEGMDRETLSAFIGPSNLARSADAGEDNAFADCLSAGEELGLFQIADGIVRLASFEKGLSTFRPLLERRVIETPETTIAPSGWLAGLISWMLNQDPRHPLPWSGSEAVNALRKAFSGQLDFGITNYSRYQQAVYWARALGYVDRTPLPEDGVIPDPTPAIERRLPPLLFRGRERPIRGFLSDLSLSCPVLDGGRLRTEIDAACGITRESFVLSPSLSLALLRLKHRGTLSLSYLDDAQAVFIDGLDGGRASHITWVRD